ncbi:class I SAM-dependent methyltransferase [Streptomyces wuyuanensis]|uniref:class I SAM-dependent methyltransferase n=1 Tax=Streptomyces wuyuanensis TaxID=1196353 RepID=UPI0034239B3A
MTTESTGTATYWESLWAEGRRYRQIDSVETGLLDKHLSPGGGRPALDVGCGEGSLARRLAQLGYRATGVDCSPSAIALAAEQTAGPGPHPVWRCMDFTTDDLGNLTDLSYAVVTCRLVYRWVDDKAAFIDRVRRLLAPGGTFWVVAEIAGRRTGAGSAQGLGITPDEEETLTAGWATVRTEDMDVLRCYALRP